MHVNTWLATMYGTLKIISFISATCLLRYWHQPWKNTHQSTTAPPSGGHGDNGDFVVSEDDEVLHHCTFGVSDCTCMASCFSFIFPYCIYSAFFYFHHVVFLPHFLYIVGFFISVSALVPPASPLFAVSAGFHLLHITLSLSFSSSRGERVCACPAAARSCRPLLFITDTARGQRGHGIH